MNARSTAQRIAREIADHACARVAEESFWRPVPDEGQRGRPPLPPPPDRVGSAVDSQNDDAEEGR